MTRPSSPFLGETTIAVLRVDVQKLDLDDIKTWATCRFTRQSGRRNC
ncbi:MAG TPA: hypothetical protein VMD30_02905 [Tepidisphaeraceae bacterium]|nr:hypothetical protein [Tepidisphaeraceae bacterium]